MLRWLAEASQGRITAEGSLVIGAGVEPAKEPSASVSLELPLQERGADVLCVECQTPGMPRTLCNACRHKLVDRLEKTERELKDAQEQMKMGMAAGAAAEALESLYKDPAVKVLMDETGRLKTERDALVAAAAGHLKGLRPLSQECRCVLCVAARAEMDR